MLKSPYKFLDSYSKEDRDIFFGREKEIEELHSRVFESRILVVYGTSGTGKSSLINCGLANKFNDSDWLPVNVRRGGNINQSLAENLEKIRITKASPGKSYSIPKTIQSIYLDHFKPVYLIFDQFEELFIFGSNDEKNEFIVNVKKVTESDLQCRFIFCVREEYLAGFTEFEKTIPSFLSNRIRIEKMTRQNAIEVIEGPCRHSGIEVEDGFAENLLEKLDPQNPEVELTYLQVYLDKIFRIASEDGKEVKKITSVMLDEAGDVKDLLGAFLEEQISRLDDPGSGLVVLKSFVSVKGTKNQITEDEVIEYSKTFGKDIDREKTKDLIQKFIRLRILRDKDENGRYELRHDTLATKIYEKITLVEKELLEIRHFLENAYNTFEKRQLYLTADDLNYIAPYEDKLFLNEKVQRFIAQSKRMIHKAKRRRQNIFIISASIIIAVLTFFTAWAFRERGNALDQKKYADEQRLIAEKQRTIADSASVIAFASRNIADEQARQAIMAQKQSDEARREALAQREIAVQQRKIAEQLSVQAREQAQIATDEKLKAEQERAKAIDAEARARRLSLLSMAQNLALKSMNMEKMPQLMGLLAVQAFNFNRDNGGLGNDPVIYDALYKAWSTLDSSRHQLFTGSLNEIRTMAFRNGRLLTADYDGVVKEWQDDGTNSANAALSVPGPVDFIKFSPSGMYIIYGVENSPPVLKCNDPQDKYEQKLEGFTGNVLSAVFSSGENFLASGSDDSIIVTWSLDKNKANRIGTLKVTGPVRLLEFCGNDTIAMVWDGKTNTGNQYYFQLNNLKGDKTYLKSNLTEKPLCLSYNHAERKLYAGYSTGAIERFVFGTAGSILKKSFSVNTTGIDQIAFNSSGSMFAISCWDKTIKLYDFDKYFRDNDQVGGTFQLRGVASRSRTMIFDDSGKLFSAMGDKTIRIWETSPQKICTDICSLVKRNLTEGEWKDYIGDEIPYRVTCGNSTSSNIGK